MPPPAPKSPRARPRVEALEDRLLLAVNVNVDAAAGRHAINPNVYGVAFADRSAVADLGVTLNRSGGNTTSSYDWQADASNHAADWYFESLPDGNGTPGGSVDQFIADTKAGGAQPVITVPMLDWVAKLGPNGDKLSSFSIAKYGPQQDADYQYFPDAGNGVRTDGSLITGNEPTDAYTANSISLQQAWLQHLVATWGSSSSGGVRYYNLDNEPSIWHETHRDVQPHGLTMDDLFNKIVAYAGMIKSVDPGAQVVGPEEWGWTGYFYSGADQEYGAAHNWDGVFPDRQNHQNMDYMPWLLDALHQYDQSTGQRLLDVFSLHYYPQGGEFSNDVSTAMQLLRNRSTRSLWDPNYVDQSWINDTVDLIPRMKGWVNTYYPGTQTGITEYNWGAEGHMNGATTEADVLGIFGREGLDRANLWTTPAAGTPAYDAIKMYRNYDGRHSTFGGTSVRAAVANPDQVSAFAALRSDGALTVMVVNKTLYDPANPGARTGVVVNLGHFLGGVAQRWQLAAVNPADQTRGQISRLADLTVSANRLTFSAPMQSVTLLVIRPPAVVRFAPTTYTVRESAGYAWLTVTRTTELNSRAAVSFATLNGGATAGSDYAAVRGVVVFLPGETRKRIAIRIVRDAVREGPQSFFVSLANAGGSYVATRLARVTILDG